jgi:hypothetical protein
MQDVIVDESLPSAAEPARISRGDAGVTGAEISEEFPGLVNRMYRYGWRRLGMIMTTEVYGAYFIEIDEEGAMEGSYRRDGRPISTALYGSDAIPVLSTMTFFDKDGATSEAKAMIDRGHMR